MSKSSFVSPEKFKEITFHISQITNKKVSVIRHEIAKKEGYDSVEAYLKKAFELNMKKYSEFDSVFCVFKNGNKKIYFTKEVNQETNIPEIISEMVIGNDAYLSNTWVGNIEGKLVAEGFIDCEGIDESEIKDSVKYYYKNSNSVQAVLFDFIWNSVFEDVNEYAEEMLFYLKEGDESFEIEKEEIESIPTEDVLEESILIKGMPKRIFEMYDENAKQEMTYDESFSSTDMTAQAIQDSYSYVYEEMLKIISNDIYNILGLKQKLYSKKLEVEDVYKIINETKNKHYKENKFYDFVSL